MQERFYIIIFTIYRDRDSDDPDLAMLWAACCLAFFGFIRAGELTVPSDQGYDPTIHLSLGDISVDNPADPGVLGVRLKASKSSLIFIIFLHTV